MNLSPSMEKFIVHWGEMGSRWGVNRTVAQIHALLYLWERPLNAEDISRCLGVARSNVSTSLKELQSWELVRLTHVLGDRRDHFEAVKDCWAMLKHIAMHRKQREINPTIEALRQCAEEAAVDEEISRHSLEQIRQMQQFVDSAGDWFDQMMELPDATLAKIIKMGAKITKWTTRKS